MTILKSVKPICDTIKLQDVLEKFREIRVPPSTSAAINNLTLHVNSFYTKVMEILVQSVVYTFSEGKRERVWCISK